MNARRREQLEREAETLAEFYQSYCARCRHAESRHNVDGDANDGACSVKDCGCPRYVEMEI
jgi:hypothetical protein